MPSVFVGTQFIASVFVGTGTARPNGREASVNNCDRRSQLCGRAESPPLQNGAITIAPYRLHEINIWEIDIMRYLLFVLLIIIFLTCLSSCYKSQEITEADRIFALNKILPEATQNLYYYNLLDDEDKEVYLKILYGFEAYLPKIVLPHRPVDETLQIFEYVLKDNPLIFYVNKFTQTSYENKKICDMAPDYIYTKEYISDKMVIVRDYLQNFEVVRGKSDYEKELYVHDYSLSKFKYEQADAESAYNILGPILHKKAVCEGIAEFVKLTLDYLNVNNIQVSGEANNGITTKMEPHRWNMVYIDDKTYHLDVTFDLTISGNDKRYDYFNLPDGEIKKDHTFTDRVPVCNTTGNDYYTLNGKTINSESELSRYISRNLQQGNKYMVVKIRNVRNKAGISDRVLSMALDRYVDMFDKSVRGEISYNINQMVFEIWLM